MACGDCLGLDLSRIRNVSDTGKELRRRSRIVRYTRPLSVAIGASGSVTAIHAKEQQVDTPEVATVRRFLDSIETHDLPARLGHLTPDAQA